MIIRRIFKMKAVGDRKTKDLRPILSNSLVGGLDYIVLEYINNDTECIIEVFGSDKSVDVTNLLEKVSHITLLDTHQLSPPRIVRYMRGTTVIDEG